MADRLHTTYSSTIFKATFQQAQELATLAGLEMIAYPADAWEWYQQSGRYSTQSYYAWEDRELAGGKCRVTWQKDLVWISAHSGYDNVATWEDVAEYAEQILHLTPVTREQLWDDRRQNPRVYIDCDKREFYIHEGD